MYNKLITLSRATLRSVAGYGSKLLDIPEGSICELVEIEANVIYGGNPTIWYRVKWRDYDGYAYAGFFDRYENMLQQDVVDLSDIETPDDTDAKQYVLIDGKRKVNQCGELSCAYILHSRLSDVLNKWESKEPNIVVRIWRGSADRGTSAQTLVGLLKSFGNNAETIDSYFKDTVLDKVFFTPTRVKSALLDGKRIIFGVKIGRDGYIGTGSINHWIVIEDVILYGRQAICHVYNPFMNRMEVYSWQELMDNSAGISGVVADFEGIDWHDDISRPEEIDVDTSNTTESDVVYKEVETDELKASEDKLQILWDDYLSRRDKE